MKKILLLLAAQFTLVLAAQAQFELPESRDLSQVRSKTLLVALQEESTSTLIALQHKPDQMKAYKDGIAKYNELLKGAVEKYWHQGKGVEYMSRLDADKEMQTGNTKYIELVLESRDGVLDPNMFTKVYNGEYTNEVRKMSKDAGFGVYRLKSPVRGKPAETFYSVYLPVTYPSQGDIIYAIRMMDNQLGKALKDRSYKDPSLFEADVKKNNKLLKNLTLLITPSQVDQKTTVDELRKYYSGNLQEVDYPKINEAIINEDSTYAYVMIVPGGEKGTKVNAAHTPVVHLVIDAATNEVLGVALSTRMDYGKYELDISKKEIKDYLQ